MLQYHILYGCTKDSSLKPGVMVPSECRNTAQVFGRFAGLLQFCLSLLKVPGVCGQGYSHFIDFAARGVD